MVRSSASYRCFDGSTVIVLCLLASVFSTTLTHMPAFTAGFTFAVTSLPCRSTVRVPSVLPGVDTLIHLPDSYESTFAISSSVDVLVVPESVVTLVSWTVSFDPLVGFVFGMGLTGGYKGSCAPRNPAASSPTEKRKAIRFVMLFTSRYRDEPQ